jgi:hypothetical protein
MREKGAGKVEFLALKEKIKKELEAGWPVKVVWRRFKTAGQVTIEYQQFRAYCKRILGYPRKEDIEHHHEQNPGNEGVLPGENARVENSDKTGGIEGPQDEKEKNQTGTRTLERPPRKFDWEGRKKTKEEIIG